MGPQILKMFNNCTIESILTGFITAWYCSCSASDRKALQKVVSTAQYCIAPLLFYPAATLCLLSMHSHFNSTYMYCTCYLNYLD